MYILANFFKEPLNPAAAEEQAGLPAVLRLEPLRPNPTGGSAIVRFSLPRAEDVRLDLLDVTGRRVVSLASGMMPAGAHSVPWDGRDAGAALVYLMDMPSGKAGAGNGKVHEHLRAKHPELGFLPLALGIKEAIPCGLLMTEILSNAMKYAFPGEKTGKVTIRFKRSGRGTYTLTMADDGIGRPGGIGTVWRAWGSRLVRSLRRRVRRRHRPRWR